MYSHRFQPEQFREAVLRRYPRIPLEALDRIVDREAQRPVNHSLSPASYVPLAVASVHGFVRHNFTNYDILLERTMRHIARDKVRRAVENYLTAWS